MTPLGRTTGRFSEPSGNEQTDARLVLDLFAGPGGWSQGLRMLGLSDIGIEWDDAACRTRKAAGHLTIRADVATYPTEPFIGRLWGLIGSPPCTLFSPAGRGTGTRVLAVLAWAIVELLNGRDVREQARDGVYPATLAEQQARNAKRKPEKRWTDEKVMQAAREDAFVCCLVLEPARFIHDCRPEWVALEQVPPVAPLWSVYAAQMRLMGYSAWTGDMSAEQYGVCQTRERRILIARRDGAVEPPVPSHRQYVKGQPNERTTDLFGDGPLPWISMAEGLRAVWPDWQPGAAAYHLARGAGMSERHGERLDTPVDLPAPVVTGKARTASWVLDTTGQTSKTVRGPEPYTRSIDDPAPTLTAQAAGFWHYRNGNQEKSCVRRIDEPAPTVLFGHRSNDVRWYEERPATTVVGSFCPDIIAAPGYRVTESRQNAEASVRVTVAEASVLQSFPADYPWQGSRTKQFEQVGNAVPPLLAAHVLSSVTGVPLEQEAAA